MQPFVDLVVLHEHPDWQKPLFAALERRGVSFAPFNVTRAAFSNVDQLGARVYFNQASPSAYVRGHTRAVPLALAYMRSLELLGARVLNGADVFALELSKSAQATLLRTLGIDCPRSITFNDVTALRAYAGDVRWPALLKPDQGGSGARIEVVESLAHVETIFRANPEIWQPDNLFLLQEFCGSRPTAASTCARRRSAIRTRAPVCAPCRRRGTTIRRRRSSSSPIPTSLRTPWPWRPKSFAPRDSTWVGSNISRPAMAGASSTTSTPIRT
jgi:hypothetical protein